jgi:hypothetical protein
MQWCLSNGGLCKAAWVQAKVPFLNWCFDGSENIGVLSWSKYERRRSKDNVGNVKRKHLSTACWSAEGILLATY